MDDSVEYYNRNAAQFYDATVELDMGQVLERFTELLPEGAAVLDLGCGSGRDSLYFIEEGFDVTALDGAGELCELARIHIGQDVLCMRFQDMNFTEVFHGVWANASLLHVPEEEIDQILDRVIRSLKPNGILFMSFKYGDFSGERSGRFFRYYNTRLLKDLIGRHSRLEIEEIFKTDDIRKNRKEEKWINVIARKLAADE